MRQPILTVVSVLCCGLVLAGCRVPTTSGAASVPGGAGTAPVGGSAPGASGGISSGEPGMTPSAPAGVGCEPGAEPAATAPGPDSEPVITVSDASPWSPEWSQLPDLVVYADGSAARNPDVGNRERPNDVPEPGLAAADGGYLDACLLQELQAELLDLRPADGEFGTPRAEDAGTTNVRIRPDAGSPEIELSAYFLSEDNSSDGSLTPEQKQARQRLSNALGRLSSGFERTGRLSVERVMVVDPGSYPTMRPVGDPNAEPVAWPLGDELPAELREFDRVCAEFTGSDAKKLAGAVEPDRHNSRVHQGKFLFGDTDSEPFEFGVAVLMPGTGGCR